MSQTPTSRLPISTSRHRHHHQTRTRKVLTPITCKALSLVRTNLRYIHSRYRSTQIMFRGTPRKSSRTSGGGPSTPSSSQRETTDGLFERGQWYCMLSDPQLLIVSMLACVTKPSANTPSPNGRRLRTPRAGDPLASQESQQKPRPVVL